jgi:nucleotide-binding universal stress UspA family protein
MLQPLPVKGFAMIALKKILVPTDFGEAADAALTYARALAQRFHASIEVLHVADDVAARIFAGEMYVGVPAEAQKDIELAARRQLDERLIDNDVDPIAITALIVTSAAPAGTIVQHAKDTNVDLIIMGTHGRGAVAHLLMGSVAERVVRLAPCPVLIVRHPEHEFVVPDMLATTARA